MKEQKFINGNVISKVAIDVIGEETEPAMKVTYTTSLKVGTLKYQIDVNERNKITT